MDFLKTVFLSQKRPFLHLNMKYLRSIVVFFLFLVLTSICYGQKNTTAHVYTKSFYDSEMGINSLISALKSVNPEFTALTSEQKDKEVKRISKDCSDSKDVNAQAVCVIIEDIRQYSLEFAKKQRFSIISDSSSNNWLPICFDDIDVTNQFIEQYNARQLLKTKSLKNDPI